MTGQHNRNSDRHKNNPLTVRLHEGDRGRVEDAAAQEDVAVNRWIADAVREKLDRGHEQAAITEGSDDHG